jgi:Co/Zn/Cd efflux system component
MDDCCHTKSCETAAPAMAARAPALQIVDDCCGSKEQELAKAAHDATGAMKHVLQIVLAINLAMFVAEFTAGVVAQSSALMADSVDMLGDAIVYGLSLYALNRGSRWRAGIALAKGGIIAVFGLGIFVQVALTMIYGVTPLAPVMLTFGAIALVANLTCLGLLYRYRAQDVNMSSTFECSRNDVIANTGVLLAAAGVYATGAAWPDIAVGAVIAIIFLRSAIRVLRQAWPQFRAPSHVPAE